MRSLSAPRWSCSRASSRRRCGDGGVELLPILLHACDLQNRGQESRAACRAAPRLAERRGSIASDCEAHCCRWQQSIAGNAHVSTYTLGWCVRRTRASRAISWSTSTRWTRSRSTRPSAACCARRLRRRPRRRTTRCCARGRSLRLILTLSCFLTSECVWVQPRFLFWCMRAAHEYVPAQSSRHHKIRTCPRTRTHNHSQA